MPFIPVTNYKVPCHDPQHNPPTHAVLPPGEYIWECPACKERQLLTIEPILNGMSYIKTGDDRKKPIDGTTHVRFG